jgi:hypothetical protein
MKKANSILQTIANIVLGIVIGVGVRKLMDVANLWPGEVPADSELESKVREAEEEPIIHGGSAEDMKDLTRHVSDE